MGNYLASDKAAELTAAMLRELLTKHDVLLVPPAGKASLVRVASDLLEYMQGIASARLPGAPVSGPDDLLRIDEVCALTGLKRPTIYKILRNPEGNFPKQIRLNPGNRGKGSPVGWVRKEVESWCAMRREVKRG